MLTARSTIIGVLCAATGIGVLLLLWSSDPKPPEYNTVPIDLTSTPFVLSDYEGKRIKVKGVIHSSWLGFMRIEVYGRLMQFASGKEEFLEPLIDAEGAKMIAVGIVVRNKVPWRAPWEPIRASGSSDPLLIVIESFEIIPKEGND